MQTWDTGAGQAAALKDLYERKAAAMRKRPGFARASGHARLTSADGLSCLVEHTGRTHAVDLALEDGGSGAAPHPGQLVRASIGACLAMGYRIWAARMEIPLDGARVEIACDYDGGTPLHPALQWKRLYVDVYLTSAASEADLHRLVEVADRLSPMLANLSSAIERAHRLTIVRPG